MNAITADFANTRTRPATSRLAAILRALADRFEAQSVAKTTARQNLEGARELKRMADKYEAYQPNLAAELRYIASRG